MTRYITPELLTWHYPTIPPVLFLASLLDNLNHAFLSTLDFMIEVIHCLGGAFFLYSVYWAADFAMRQFDPQVFLAILALYWIKDSEMFSGRKDEHFGVGERARYGDEKEGRGLFFDRTVAVERVPLRRA